MEIFYEKCKNNDWGEEEKEFKKKLKDYILDGK